MNFRNIYDLFFMEMLSISEWNEYLSLVCHLPVLTMWKINSRVGLWGSVSRLAHNNYCGVLILLIISIHRQGSRCGKCWWPHFVLKYEPLYIIFQVCFVLNSNQKLLVGAWGYVEKNKTFHTFHDTVMFFLIIQTWLKKCIKKLYRIYIQL